MKYLSAGLIRRRLRVYVEQRRSSAFKAERKAIRPSDPRARNQLRDVLAIAQLPVIWPKRAVRRPRKYPAPVECFSSSSTARWSVTGSASREAGENTITANKSV